LITIGAGMMLVGMDLAPACRYAVDLSGYDGDGLIRFVETLPYTVDFVAVLAIAMTTNAQKLREAVSKLRRTTTLPVYVYSNVRLALDELSAIDDLSTVTRKHEGKAR
jgi:hypothetical protein